METISTAAAILSVAGALMLAMKTPGAKWAWVLWTVSNVLWIGWALREQQWALLGQQCVFLGTSLLGVWQWVVRPHRERARADS